MDISFLESIDFSFLAQYVKADPSIFIIGTAISGTVGFIMPWILPFIFKFFERIFKREITKDEKRDVITYIALGIALTTIGVRYEFSDGTIWQEGFTLIATLLYYLSLIKGMVQLVYEKIIKTTGADVGLEKLAGN